MDADGEEKMKSVVNIVSFDSNVDKEVLSAAESAGLKVTTLD